MENMDHLQNILQASSMPVVGAVGYFLWKISVQITELKVSIDTLVDTLIRLVPGTRKDG